MFLAIIFGVSWSDVLGLKFQTIFTSGHMFLGYCFGLSLVGRVLVDMCNLFRSEFVF